MEDFIEAIEEGNIDTVRIKLLKNSSAAEMLDLENNTLVHAAVIYSQQEILLSLLNHVKDITGNTNIRARKHNRMG